MVSMYMPNSVLLQKSSGNERVQRDANKNAENYTWLFVGLLIFTVVVSIVIWLMRRKIDREMSKDLAFEQQQQSSENYAVDPISDEDTYDDNKRRLYEVLGYSTDIDFKRSGTTESIFTFSDKPPSYLLDFSDRSYRGYTQSSSRCQVAPI